MVRANGRHRPACLSTRPRLGSSHMAHAFWSRKRKQHTESPPEEDSEADFETELAPGDPTCVRTLVKAMANKPLLQCDDGFDELDVSHQ